VWIGGELPVVDGAGERANIRPNTPEIVSPALPKLTLWRENLSASVIRCQIATSPIRIVRAVRSSSSQKIIKLEN